MSIIPKVTEEDSLDPNLDEVLQDDQFLTVIPVKLDGPQPVHVLPAINAAVFSTSITVTPVTITGADMKRSRAVLLGFDGAFWFGTSSTNCITPWPQGVPLILTNTDTICARSATGTVVLSTVLEYWAS